MIDPDKTPPDGPRPDKPPPVDAGKGNPAPIEVGVVTHPGKVRSRNEDRYFAAPEFGVFAVADGMGGHEGGALASATLVEALGSIGAAVSAPDLLARLEDRVLLNGRKTVVFTD